MHVFVSSESKSVWLVPREFVSKIHQLNNPIIRIATLNEIRLYLSLLDSIHHLDTVSFVSVAVVFEYLIVELED